MMDLYLMIAILLANIIGIVIVYQFIKKLDKKEKLIFIAVSIAIMYILVSIVYWISGFGIEEEVHEASKNFVLYLFVPVNTILFVPYIASKYMKLKEKEIKRDRFVNKLSIIIVLLIIVLVIEYFYFRGIQNNIKEINHAINEIQEEQVEKEDKSDRSANSQKEEKTHKNEIDAEVNTKTNTINEKITNEEQDEEDTNQVSNTVRNNISNQIEEIISNNVVD